MTAGATTAGPKLRGDDRGAALRGRAFQAALLFSVTIGFVLLAVLLVDVVRRGTPFLDSVLLTQPSSTRAARAGAGPAILGTIYLMALLLVMTVPIGVGTALYLEEYANRERWYNRALEVNIQNLAAVPSIVYGILGLAFIVRGPLSLGPVVLAGSLTLGLLVLPVVIIAGREAIRAVPPSIREGSLALGATQWQTISKQVLPAAVPGIATGVILALSRAIGETAPLIVIGAASFVTFSPDGPNSIFTAVPLQMYDWISRPQEEFHQLAAAGILVLMTVLLVMNSVAIWLRNKYESKW